MIGTATESLNRTLADFKDEGLIEISEEGIKIREKAKIRAPAGGFCQPCDEIQVANNSGPPFPVNLAFF